MFRVPVLCLLVAIGLSTPALAEDAQEARFTTEDGVEIVGTFLPAEVDGRAPVVILLHMYNSNRHAWKPLTKALHDAGIATLAVDMRGHGDSVKPASMSLADRMANRDEALFCDMYRDVFAAYEWLSEQPTVDLSRFGIVGASVGCSVAIDYAARDRSVDVVVCMSPGENYLGVDSRKHIAEFAKHGQRPILLLATEDERKACDTLAKIDNNATVNIVGPGLIHGTHMFGKFDGIEKQIVEFLTKPHDADPGRPVVAPVDGNEYFDLGSIMDIKLDQAKRRHFSSSEEAESRGLTRAEGIEAMMIDDHLTDEQDLAPQSAPPSDERQRKRKQKQD